MHLWHVDAAYSFLSIKRLFGNAIGVLRGGHWALGPGILATFRNAFWPVFWPVLATFDIITENQLSTPNFSVLIYCVLATFRYVTQLLFELLF